MKRIRWSPEAVDDLEHIVDYIRLDKPGAARRIARTIYSAIETLRRSPHRGRQGRIAGTRELIFAPLPYIAVYRMHDDAIEVVRIWHSARNRP